MAARSILRRGALAGGALSAIALLLVGAIQLRVAAELPSEPADDEIRVVTYNIRAGLQGIDQVAEDLRRLSPDVIALQEVGRGATGALPIDQPRHLASSLGLHVEFARAIGRPGAAEYGLAILSRYPISETEVVSLPQGHGRWPRIALKARIDRPAGPFRMVCVHLARPWGWPGSNGVTRLRQIGALLRNLRTESLPLVVAGDFNAFPISAEAWRIARRLRPAWRPWRDGWLPTFSLRSIGWPGGWVQIDQIHHARSWGSRGCWAAPPGASDHRAVIADLVPGKSESG